MALPIATATGQSWTPAVSPCRSIALQAPVAPDLADGALDSTLQLLEDEIKGVKQLVAAQREDAKQHAGALRGELQGIVEVGWLFACDAELGGWCMKDLRPAIACATMQEIKQLVEAQQAAAQKDAEALRSDLVALHQAQKDGSQGLAHELNQLRAKVQAFLASRPQLPKPIDERQGASKPQPQRKVGTSAMQEQACYSQCNVHGVVD